VASARGRTVAAAVQDRRDNADSQGNAHGLSSGAVKQDEQPEIDHDRELLALTALFVLWYGSMLKAVHTLVVTVLNLTPVPLDDPAIRQIVLDARAAAVAVDATTKRLIAERIAEGASRGLSPVQIAYGTEDFPGISGLFQKTWKNRPLTVAQTELQRAQLLATTQRFTKLARGRIEGWLATDGDYDSFCAGRNGATFPPNAPPDLAHPHCRLTIRPILR
jgi:hypothetical protein